LFVNSSQLKFEKKAFVPNFVKGLGNITKNKYGVSPRLLKDIAYSISKPLTQFFNMSLSIKQVPLLWKIAHVCPIFKGKGNPHLSLKVKGLGNITKNKSDIPSPIHITNNIMIYFNQLINS
jgi:hypothetical protein